MILRRYLRAICLLLFALSVCLILHLLHSSGEDAAAASDLRLEGNYGYWDATGEFKILSHVQVATNWTELSKVSEYHNFFMCNNIYIITNNK
jgi:hypothetical protein